MFKGCSQLIYLDLSNLNTSQVTSMASMFSGNPALKYINLLHYQGDDIFGSITIFNNLTICIQNYTQIKN